MKNREKWAQEIIDIALSGDVMAIKNGKPVYCSAIRCAECDLHQFCECGPGPGTEQRVRAWAEAEAAEE